MVALGLFLVLLKIGRPLRFINVLRQPQRSWMAREAWIAAVLFPLAGLALWSQAPAPLIAAAIVAMLFLYSQAMILKEARGIPAWRISWVVPLVFATGLAEGGGLFLAATAQFVSFRPLVELVAVAVIALAALRALIWRYYQAALEGDGAPTRTFAIFHDYRPWFFIAGLALPSALIVAFVFNATATTEMVAIAGLCIATAGIALKFILITRAGFNQGFALDHTPVRGAGIAGSAIKPGWSLSRTIEKGSLP